MLLLFALSSQTMKAQQSCELTILAILGRKMVDGECDALIQRRSPEAIAGVSSMALCHTAVRMLDSISEHARGL